MIKPNLNLEKNTILITGVAGFIGSNLAKRLVTVRNVKVIGIDNLSNYYDVSLKQMRLNEIKNLNDKFIFEKGDISDKEFLKKIFNTYKPKIVVNLAAQPGVRYSIDHPDEYIKSNVVGFFNILEQCRNSSENGMEIKHLIYASSSSVYGIGNTVPYSIDSKVDTPVSLYAATKKSNELMAHVYSKLYDIPCTGLRFFTVYGPAGRPDMAYFKFANQLLSNKKIDIYNYGNCRRDFTYIDDIIEGIINIIVRAPEKKKGKDGLPIPAYKIYNIGNHQPEKLMDFVNILSKSMVEHGILEQKFNIIDHINMLPMQPGDVEETYADISNLIEDTGFKPSTNLQEGIDKFVEWYKNYIN